MEPIESSETSAYNNTMTPGTYPKEKKLQSKHGESLKSGNFDVLLTVHLHITLATDQLDAQLLYFTILLLQSSTCFEQRRAHYHEVKLY
jgi:hypothetical protein